MSDDASDDDWFESALDGDGEDDVSAEGDEDGSADAETPFESASDRPDSTDAEDPFADGESGSEDVSSDDDSPFDGGSGGESPFAGGSDADSSFDETDADNPFDGGSDGTSPFDGDGDEGGLFDDDFASEFGAAGGDSDGTDEFSDEDFESDIPRIDIGIEGLDGMIQGGIPERHLIVAIGSAGTGKTTFGLQFLHHGLENDETCIFLTLEQSHRAIMDTANERGWGFDEYEADDRLAVIDLDPVEMANSLDNIRNELPELIEDFDADRLVLDSVSLLEMMYDQPAKRRTEVFDFTRSLKDAGVTTMLTSEASENNPYASRHGIIEYLTDAVFVLQYVRGEATETRTAIEIQKIRNANHSRETKPYEITMDGISVYQQANIF